MHVCGFVRLDKLEEVAVTSSLLEPDSTRPKSEYMHKRIRTPSGKSIIADPACALATVGSIYNSPAVELYNR